MRPTLIFLVVIFSGCYRETIQFEGDPPESYTQLVRIDTVTTQLSTVMIDSFATGSANNFLIGGYDDPYFGKISTRAFLQITRPETAISIAENALFDSLELIIHLNHYFYGDSTKPVTIEVHQLDENIVLGYNDKLYNTSNFGVKSPALGSKQLKVYPYIYDSINMRLDQASGLELFGKLKAKADEMATLENFINYFKGLRIGISDATRGVVYGIDSVKMRLHYHTTTPLPQQQSIDFNAAFNTLSFRQVLVDRNGILPPGEHELPTSATNGFGFTQPATGVLLKAIFPGLRNLLSTDKPVNLLHAELIIRPVSQTFTTYTLPPALQLAQTDESNFVGALLADSTGQAAITATPIIDQLYGLNNYYRFNVTNAINILLNTPASAGKGFFILPSTPEQSARLDRAVFGDALHMENKAQLILSIVTVNLD